MRRFEDYIFYTSQVEHEKLGIYNFRQSKPGLNSFIHREKSNITVGILTKSCLNIITPHPSLTDITTPQPPNIKKEFSLNYDLPEDDLLSATIMQKPADYISKVNCIRSDMVSNSFISIGEKYVEYILAQNDKCFAFRLPAALIMVN